MKKSGKTFYFSKNIAISNFFFRFVVQQNQYLLVNGLQTKDQAVKDKLGFGFDKTLEAIGEKSLVHGVCFGYWNYDHMERFEAVSNDGFNGFFALLDERTSEPMVGIRFWQLDKDKAQNIQLYETDGVTEYTRSDSGLVIYREKTPYRSLNPQDLRAGKRVPEDYRPDYGTLPIVPLYANEYGRSEFTKNIKTKIDLYDKIFSDFGDNLERTNDIYWVITNFGGNVPGAKELLAEIEEYRAVFSDENANAEPHTIEVPYAARQVALDLLERAMYADFMAMNMSDITGGSLTNVAIRTATANLEAKVHRYEFQVHAFCQKILALAGTATEDIKFRYQTIANDQELLEMLMSSREDFDTLTALNKNPLVEIDEIDTILDRIKNEPVTRLDDVQKVTAILSIMLSDGYIDEETAVKLHPWLQYKLDEAERNALLTRLAVADLDMPDDPIDEEPPPIEE